MSVLGIVLGGVDVLFRKWAKKPVPRTCEWCLSSEPLAKFMIDLIEKKSIGDPRDIVSCYGLGIVLRTNTGCDRWNGPRAERTGEYLAPVPRGQTRLFA